MSYRIHLKTDHSILDLPEALRAEPVVLHGVTTAANELLETLQIGTVFDLALSATFAKAARIVAAADDPDSIMHQHGSAPADMVDWEHRDTPLGQLPERPVHALVGIESIAPELEETLDVASIRDLAKWPPYLAAKHLVREAFMPHRTPGFDPELPRDLLPKTGEYATQRVQYSTTVLIETKASSSLEWKGGPIDLAALDSLGFADVAFGAVMTFGQTWTPKSVALGQLLHSVPLAPGESTRMAVVDWTRRVTSSTREEIDQTEALGRVMQQAASISEITSSVAREHQQGVSTSASASASASAGGVGLGARPVPTLSGSMAPVPMLATASGGASLSGAASYTVSSGSRDVVANAMQSINARTQQSSSLVRSRRAAIVTEVSEAESERITTRNVTNYNHMHALSIQYYEVVQLYETTVGLQRIERCIFIPMRLVNLRAEANLRRYLGILIRSTADPETRAELLRLRDTVVVAFLLDRFARDDLAALRGDLVRIRSNLHGPDRFTPTLGDDLVSLERESLLDLADCHQRLIALHQLDEQIVALRRRILANLEAGRRKRMIERHGRSDLSALTLDRDVVVEEVAWDPDDGISKVTIVLRSDERLVIGAPGAPDQTTIPLEDIQEIRVTRSPAADARPSDFGIFDLRVRLERLGQEHWLDLGFVASKGIGGELDVLRLRAPIDLAELSERLMAHQLYYSQQIWLHADQQSLLMQLTEFEYAIEEHTKLRIVDYIDPAPVTVAGNYLAFRFTYGQDAPWKDWIEQQRSVPPQVDIVPVPTGGVFAEAVLGELNSAEKLDARRFWKWDDSPIPFRAGEIGPIAAGRHARVGAPPPGRLPTPGVTLQELPPLPALVTTNALTNAILSAKMFNDMSGHELTHRLLQASMAAAKGGNLAAQQQAQQALARVYEAVAKLTKALVVPSPDLVATITQLGSLLGMVGEQGSGGGEDGAEGGEGAEGGGGGGGGIDVGDVASLVAKVLPFILSFI